MKLPAIAIALQQRSFIAYLAGHWLSMMGPWAQRVVLYWIAWEATGSAMVLGLIATADLIPSVIAAPIAGALADRYDRRVIAVWLQLLSVIPSLLATYAILLGATSTPILVTLSLVVGISNGFDHPVRMVLVSSLIERQQLSSAITLNSMILNLGRMIGPALGGAAILSGQLWGISLLNALSYLPFAFVLSRLRSKNGSEPPSAGSASVGWMQLWPQLRGVHRAILLYFGVIALLIMPVFELLPAFATDISPGSNAAAELLSVMTSALAVGAAFGAIVIGGLSTRYSPSQAVLLSGVATALSAALFLLSTSAWAAVASVAALSAFIVANGIASQVLLQSQIPDRGRGKVLSIYAMMFRGLPALGVLAIGIMGDLLLQTVLWIATAALASASFIFFLFLRNSSESR